MTLARASLFLIAIAVFSCSEKESEEPWGQTGDVKGQVVLYTEFGAMETEQGGAVVTFQSGSSDRSVTTDAEGSFVAEDIPMGTYNLRMEKPGFASRTIPGYRLIGGENPTYANLAITRPSTTTITDLTASFSQNTLILSGNVHHNSPYDFAQVGYVVFAGTSADVSPAKHDQSSLYWYHEGSGGSFSQDFYLNRNKFPSGSTVYIVLYGSARLYSYDNSLDRPVYDGVGDTPSNVVSVVVP